MLTDLAQKIVSLLNWDDANSQQKEICIYGCEALLYTLFSTAGLLFIGGAAGYFMETVVIVLLFYLCQSTGGGYHAQSHLSCFLTMATGLCLALTILYFCSSRWLFCIMLGLSTYILLMHPLCLHSNKSYLQVQANQLELRSKITTLILFTLIAISEILGQYTVSSAACLAMLLSACSRLYSAIVPLGY